MNRFIKQEQYFKTVVLKNDNSCTDWNDSFFKTIINEGVNNLIYCYSTAQSRIYILDTLLNTDALHVPERREVIVLCAGMSWIAAFIFPRILTTSGCQLFLHTLLLISHSKSLGTWILMGIFGSWKWQICLKIHDKLFNWGLYNYL